MSLVEFAVTDIDADCDWDPRFGPYQYPQDSGGSGQIDWTDWTDPEIHWWTNEDLPATATSDPGSGQVAFLTNGGYAFISAHFPAELVATWTFYRLRYRVMAKDPAGKQWELGRGIATRSWRSA